jgi:glyoxylase-like metal-dependent hydrolase (beta-lactamase superfamily II)
MKTITDRIERINVRLPDNPLKSLNSYIVKGDDRNLLIDTGFHLPESFSDLREGIRALSIDMEHTDIFLTHCHADHTGNAGRIASASSVIYASSIDKALIEMFVEEHDGLVRYFDDCMVRDGFPDAERESSLSANPAAHNNERNPFTIAAIEDGHVFDLGGICLRALCTPGHTPGHMCLYIEKDGILFTGDHVLFDITPNITDWKGVDDSLGDYMGSLMETRDMDVRLALPGHRESGDFVARTDELLGHHEARFGETYGIVKREDGQTCYEIASKMRWRISCNDWNAFPPAQKFFAVGEARSHLQYLRIRGRIRVTEDNGVERYYTT